MIDLPILSTETIESIESCYFGPTFNLTKQQLLTDITELTETYHKLMNREIPPRRVVGGGLKNSRKIAENWLKQRISESYYLLKHFDEKNQLTESQKKSLTSFVAE